MIKASCAAGPRWFDYSAETFSLYDAPGCLWVFTSFKMHVQGEVNINFNRYAVLFL